MATPGLPDNLYPVRGGQLVVLAVKKSTENRWFQVIAATIFQFLWLEGVDVGIGGDLIPIAEWSLLAGRSINLEGFCCGEFS